MRISARQVVGWGAVVVATLGSGPCPGCYDDECSKGETYCHDGVAYYCDEPNENGAYVLLSDDCASRGEACVVVPDEEAADDERAVCLAACVDDCGCEADLACVDGACQPGSRDAELCCGEGDAGPVAVPCPVPCDDDCGCGPTEVCTQGTCQPGMRPAELCCGPEC